MAGLKKTVLTATLISAGGLLYTGLNWIPIVGPMAVGFAVGYVLKENPFNSFKAGVYSAAVGVMALGLLLGGMGLFNPPEAGALTVLLVTWVLVVWNFFGILLAGFGGILGSLTGQARRIVDTMMPAMRGFPFSVSFGMPKPRNVVRLRPPPMEEREKQGSPDRETRIRFSICPNCGSSNPQSSRKCETCGHVLGRGK